MNKINIKKFVKTQKKKKYHSNEDYIHLCTIFEESVKQTTSLEAVIERQSVMLHSILVLTEHIKLKIK